MRLPDRKEIADFINHQLENGSPNKKGAGHYGVYELRELMDKLYGGAPTDEAEHIVSYTTAGVSPSNLHIKYELKGV